MSNVVIVWKPTARNELALVENRTGAPKGYLKKIFKTVATKHRDSVCIDMTEGSPSKYRLNLWTRLDDEDSDDD